MHKNSLDCSMWFRCRWNLSPNQIQQMLNPAASNLFARHTHELNRSTTKTITPTTISEQLPLHLSDVCRYIAIHINAVCIRNGQKIASNNNWKEKEVKSWRRDFRGEGLRTYKRTANKCIDGNRKRQKNGKKMRKNTQKPNSNRKDKKNLRRYIAIVRAYFVSTIPLWKSQKPATILVFSYVWIDLCARRWKLFYGWNCSTSRLKSVVCLQ